MFSNLIVEEVGKEIQLERERQKLSRTKLASYSQVDSEIVKELENGYYKNLDFCSLVEICRTLKMNVFSFLKEGITITELLNTI